MEDRNDNEQSDKTQSATQELAEMSGSIIFHDKWASKILAKDSSVFERSSDIRQATLLYAWCHVPPLEIYKQRLSGVRIGLDTVNPIKRRRRARSHRLLNSIAVSDIDGSDTQRDLH
jgi:hypothetical protein